MANEAYPAGTGILRPSNSSSAVVSKSAAFKILCFPAPVKTATSFEGVVQRRIALSSFLHKCSQGIKYDTSVINLQTSNGSWSNRFSSFPYTFAYSHRHARLILRSLAASFFSSAVQQSTGRMSIQMPKLQACPNSRFLGYAEVSQSTSFSDQWEP